MQPPAKQGLPWVRTMLLYHRLYEAHVLPSHLTIALISALIFTSNVPPEFTYPFLLQTLDICAILRFIGFCATAFFIYFYEKYHFTSVSMREEEMRRADLYEDMQGNFAYRGWSNWTDYVVLPINGTLFGTLPAVVAQFSHLWTTTLAFSVSAKPQVKRSERDIQMV